MRRRTALLISFAVLALPAPAAAAGGQVGFDGGTPSQRAEVRAALGASAFDFSLLPQVTVHIHVGAATMSQRGHVWVDARLLDTGRFSWASVLDEFAHQVDFFLLDDARRGILNTALGGRDWCYSVPGLAHADYGCERFSSVFAWAYWPSADNAYKPRGAKDESAAMPAQAFRTLLGSLLGIGDPLTAQRPVATAQRQALTHRARR